MNRFALARLPRVNLTHYIHPMLAKLVEKPFDGEGWVFEVKWDGYRAIAEIDRGKVSLYSRNGLGFESAFKPIVDALKRIKHQAVLDGEVVVLDEKGRSDFQSLQNFIATQEGQLVFYAFDVLEVNGKDLRGEPLLERKKFLPKLCLSKIIRVSDHVKRTGGPCFGQQSSTGSKGSSRSEQTAYTGKVMATATG